MKNLICSIGSLVFGFMIGTALKYSYESTFFRPYTWNEPPKIINCYGPDFSKLHMIRGINYWILRDHALGSYIHEPGFELCEKDWINGYIMLKKQSALDDNILASTKRYTSLNKIKGAVILYRPQSFSLYLLNEHELGHALGYSHIEREGHVMHPVHVFMGLDFYSH